MKTAKANVLKNTIERGYGFPTLWESIILFDVHMVNHFAQVMMLNYFNIIASNC